MNILDDLGDDVIGFEESFAKFHNRKHAFVMYSGQSAMDAALKALKTIGRHPLKAGHKVLVPALSWTTPQIQYRDYDLEPVPAEIDDTWCDSGQMGECNLVVGSCPLGNPGHLAWWSEYCRRTGAYFIEDCREGFGCITRGWDSFRNNVRAGPLDAKAGSFGFMSVFDLKAITGSSCGVLLTDDDECAEFVSEWARDRINSDIANVLNRLDGWNRQLQQNWNNFQVWADILPVEKPLRNGIMNPLGIAFGVKGPRVRDSLLEAFQEAGVQAEIPKKLEESLPPKAARVAEIAIYLKNQPVDMLSKLDKATDIMKSVLCG